MSSFLCGRRSSSHFGLPKDGDRGKKKFLLAFSSSVSSAEFVQMSGFLFFFHEDLMPSESKIKHENQLSYIQRWETGQAPCAAWAEIKARHRLKLISHIVRESRHFKCLTQSVLIKICSISSRQSAMLSRGSDSRNLSKFILGYKQQVGDWRDGYDCTRWRIFHVLQIRLACLIPARCHPRVRSWWGYSPESLTRGVFFLCHTVKVRNPTVSVPPRESTGVLLNLGQQLRKELGCARSKGDKGAGGGERYGSE